MLALLIDLVLYSMNCYNKVTSAQNNVHVVWILHTANYLILQTNIIYQYTCIKGIPNSLCYAQHFKQGIQSIYSKRCHTIIGQLTAITASLNVPIIV